MRQKSSIANFVLATVAAVAALAAFSTRAADVEIKESATDRYTVQKGDTLWGIAGGSSRIRGGGRKSGG